MKQAKYGIVITKRLKLPIKPQKTLNSQNK